MRRPELPALTGIRFYAAILVYLSHVPLIPGMGKLAGDNLIFNAGVVGVSFFFVLSGFILTYNYADLLRVRTAPSAMVETSSSGDEGPDSPLRSAVPRMKQ